MYHLGKGLEQNSKKALEWLLKAAHQGNASAACNIGYMYYHGQGIKKDIDKGIDWIKKAAERGNKNAQSFLNGIN